MSENVTSRQKKAIRALLANPTLTQAANEAGVSRQTIYRWMKQPAFRKELRTRQDAVIAVTTAALVGLSGEAIQVLRDVLEDPEVKPAVRVRAALGWLREQREAVELADLAVRIAALEEAFNEQFAAAC